MRLVVNTDRGFFKIFNTTIKKYVDTLNCDKIEVKFGPVERTSYENKSLIMEFDRENYFIKNNDTEGIRILILKKLFTLALHEVPYFISQIIADRRIIREGVSKQLAYYHYTILSLKKKEIKNLEGFLEINIPWLSFHKIDNYNSELFRSYVKNFIYNEKLESATKNLFSVISRPVTSASLEKAIKECERVQNEYKAD